MKIIKLVISLFIALSLISNYGIALTDPEPNPFDNLEEGEQVFEAIVSNVDAEILTVKNSEAEEFSGRFDQIWKYRDGGGPAAADEFFIDDTVRVMVDANSVVRAAQNYELLLCDQNFYGWVKNPTEDNFTLETIEGEKFNVKIGPTTQYRSETGEQLFGYSPLGEDIVRIHGVVNTNVKEIFTETFGAYISLLAEDALAPFLVEIETRKAELLTKPQFPDVSAEQEFFHAINFVKIEEVVDGYEDGTYRPDQLINRAEFTKILIGSRFADELGELLTENCFPDFEKEEWFAPYVCLAKEKGIINGYPDGTFQPANEVNLAEAITILTGTFELGAEALKENEQWFDPFITKANELQILPADFAEPNDLLTRGQMAELVMRAMKYVSGELEEYLND